MPGEGLGGLAASRPPEEEHERKPLPHYTKKSTQRKTTISKTIVINRQQKNIDTDGKKNRQKNKQKMGAAPSRASLHKFLLTTLSLGREIKKRLKM